MLQDKPIGLIMTFSMAMITEGGTTLREFLRAFERLNDDNACWLQKCRNKPKHEVLYCYIIIAGRVYYRANVSHWEPGGEINATNILKPGGDILKISWPRLVLTPPIVKAPEKIPMRGFQGFRYVTEEIF